MKPIMRSTEFVPFAGDMVEIHPYRVWQKLFDYYRERDCMLGRMHNLMIDYENCKKLFETLDGKVVFLWGCDTGSWSTRWCNEDRFIDGSYELTARIYPCDFFCLVFSTRDGATFTPFFYPE